MERISSTSNFRLIKTIIFSLLMLIALYFTLGAIGEYYGSLANKNAVNEKSDKRMEDFYALPKNSLDIAFVGSSHSYCSFDPENFDYALGTSSFQLGMPLQHPDATYYTVRELFNYQKPKTLVLEVYWDMLDDDGDMKQAITLFDSLKNKELEKEYVNEVFSPAEKIKYSMEIINYQKDFINFQTAEIKNNWKTAYDLTDAEEKQEGEEYYRSKGYVYCSYTLLPEEFGRTNQYNGFNGNKFEILEKQRGYLKRIVDLCNENGTKVFFVTAPVANVSIAKIQNYGLINKKISDMAKSFNVPYIDYNMPNVRGDMFADSNFRDDAHLNDSGVKILNKHFIEFLTSIS